MTDRHTNAFHYSGHGKVGPAIPKDEIIRIINDRRGEEGMVVTWGATRSGVTVPETNGYAWLELAWGTADARFTALVDVKSGGRLWVAASSLTVTAIHSGAIDRDWDIAVSVGPGRSEVGSATLTIAEENVAPGQSRRILIPPFAAWVTIFPSFSGTVRDGPFMNAEWRRGPAGSYAIMTGTELCNGTYTEPVPGHCDMLSVANVSTETMRFVAIWGLLL